MKDSFKDEHRKVAESSNTNFLYSFSVLSGEKNDALNTIYAFCRKTDDIVDNDKHSPDEKLKNLDEWREKFTKAISGIYEDTFIEKVDLIRRKFSIPVEPFHDLIDGMEMDIKKNRFNDFSELKEYCYKVAATVGLMCLEVFGYHSQDTKKYAMNLGVALQLTNIMRDVKTDSVKNRIYLPLDEMAKFGYTEKMLFENKYNREFRDLMNYQYKRAERYYDIANSYLKSEDKGLMVSAKIMEEIYHKILLKIKALSYDVLNYDVKLSKFTKVRIAIVTLYKYKLLYNAEDPRREFQ